MNSSREEDGGGGCVKIWSMNGEGRVDRKELGERGSWRRRRKKEGLKGCRARCEGIWGGQERDGWFGGGRCVSALVRANARECPIPFVFSCSLQGRDRLSICQYALINMTKGSNLTTRSVCAGMLAPLCVCRCASSARVCRRSSVLVTPDLRFTSKLYRGVCRASLRLTREKTFLSLLHFPS